MTTNPNDLDTYLKIAREAALRAGVVLKGEELRTWTQGLVEQIAKRLPVVLLESGLYADDHADFPLTGQNVLSIQGHVTPQNNLAVQSAVLAKAQAFVGTYGGTMQLAVRLKKPSVGFYAKFEGTCYAHKQ